MNQNKKSSLINHRSEKSYLIKQHIGYRSSYASAFVIVGSPKIGKTTLINECIRSIKRYHKYRGLNVMVVDGKVAFKRMISGMTDHDFDVVILDWNSELTKADLDYFMQYSAPVIYLD